MMKSLVGLFLQVFWLEGVFGAGGNAKIASTLDTMFDMEGEARVNVMVTLKEKPSMVFNRMEVASIQDSAELHVKALGDMKLMAEETQAPVLKLLESVEHKSYWITNQIYVKGASKKLCEALAKIDGVEGIEEEQIFHIHEPIQSGQVFERMEGKRSRISFDSPQWNIEKIKANQVWGSTKGEGTVVAVIDTGVRATHESLPEKFLIAFHDAVNGKTKAYDDNGHGTHVTSTICGKNGIGVAPGVKIVSCKACDKLGICGQRALTECCQFVTEHSPNVVSNSWGGTAGKPQYADVIKNWKSLNIYTVASAGNSGPDCDTIGSPADYANVCSVGATTKSDSLAVFSSRGQCQNGLVGPIVSAPGDEITAAWHTSDKAYNTLSGTSMAAPHVSGAAALLHSLHKKISYEDMTRIIVNSCQFSGLTDTKQSCGGTTIAQHPNNMYGNGRIDCNSAATHLTNQLLLQSQTQLKRKHSLKNRARAHKTKKKNHQQRKAFLPPP